MRFHGGCRGPIVPDPLRHGTVTTTAVGGLSENGARIDYHDGLTGAFSPHYLSSQRLEEP